MPGLFVFLLKVNIALLVFCAGYYLVLRQLTFYTLNRIYLATAILFASIYPKINLSGFLERHQHLTSPVQKLVYNFQAPAKALIRPLAKPDYWQWAGLVFWIGAAVLAVRLLIQFISLFRIYRNSKAGQLHGHEVRIINGDSGPFSFWKNIYVNPTRHEPGDLKSILLHEQVHVTELHTLDILLAEISSIFYWFNPGIWLIKKAIRENIEFITDRKILRNGIDTKQYQYSLVNVSFSAAPRGIVNHFNISTIKKRIIMMNAKRSSTVNLTRYAFLVPAVVALLLVFSISKAALVKKGARNNFYSAITFGKSNLAILKDIGVSSSTTLPLAGNTKNPTSLNIALPAKTSHDTIRNGGVFINTSDNSDSLKYVINGVKSTKADFKALDPDHIYSVEMLSAEQANAILNETGNTHSVLFVTTDDSDSGKKFKEKIDQLNDGPKVIGFSSASGNGTLAVTTSGDSNGSGISYSTGTANASGGDVLVVETAPKLYKFKAMKVSPRKFKGDSLTLKVAPFTARSFDESDTLRGYTLNTAKGVYTISPKYKFAPKSTMHYNGDLKINRAYSTRGYTISAYTNNETNIEHLSAKMIMIDGKEASEHDLKKLSAAQIESMSVKSGDEITKKYGDKAKNGVVFITTKK